MTDGVALANLPKPGKHPLPLSRTAGRVCGRECAREWMMALINERSQFVRASTHAYNGYRLYTQPLFSNLSNTAYSRHTCTLYTYNNNIRSSSQVVGRRGGGGCTSQKPRYLFGLRINHGTKHGTDRIRPFLVSASVRR